MSKGVSQIATAAIYIGVTVAAISIALSVGAPALANMQDAASIRQAQKFMQQLDNNVQSVVSEGEGSTLTISSNFDRGEVYFDNDSKVLIYELQTDADVISPQTSKRSGNVVLSSSARVKVYNETIDGTDCYMMENERVKACIKKIGSSSNPDNLSTSELLVHYEFIEGNSNRELNTNLTVELNEENATTYGEGYTEADFGDYIGTGEVKATVASEYGFKYDIFFRLPTGADFLKVDVQNFR